MANWEKLNKELDHTLNSMTYEDWLIWAKKFRQKQKKINMKITQSPVLWLVNWISDNPVHTLEMYAEAIKFAQKMEKKEKTNNLYNEGFDDALKQIEMTHQLISAEGNKDLTERLEVFTSQGWKLICKTIIAGDTNESIHYQLIFKPNKRVRWYKKRNVKQS